MKAGVGTIGGVVVDPGVKVLAFVVVAVGAASRSVVGSELCPPQAIASIAKAQIGITENFDLNIDTLQFG